MRAGRRHCAGHSEQRVSTRGYECSEDSGMRPSAAECSGVRVLSSASRDSRVRAPLLARRACVTRAPESGEEREEVGAQPPQLRSGGGLGQCRTWNLEGCVLVQPPRAVAARAVAARAVAARVEARAAVVRAEKESRRRGWRRRGRRAAVTTVAGAREGSAAAVCSGPRESTFGASGSGTQWRAAGDAAEESCLPLECWPAHGRVCLKLLGGIH